MAGYAQNIPDRRQMLLDEDAFEDIGTILTG